MPETLFATLLPALVVLTFRTLCTLAPAPVPTYLKWCARTGGISMRCGRRRRACCRSSACEHRQKKVRHKGRPY